MSHHLHLMLYHRLLSCLLVTPAAASLNSFVDGQRARPLDFNQILASAVSQPSAALLQHVIRGTRRLIEGRTGAGYGDTSFECLDDLVKMWHMAVEDLNVDGVDDTLTLEYSLQTLADAIESNPGGALQPAPQMESAHNGRSSQESDISAVGLSQDPDTTEVANDMAISRNNALPNDLLGVKRFHMDDRKLDAHLHNILRWWHGQCRPKGVPKGLERRCE